MTKKGLLQKEMSLQGTVEGFAAFLQDPNHSKPFIFLNTDKIDNIFLILIGSIVNQAHRTDYNEDLHFIDILLV